MMFIDLHFIYFFPSGEEMAEMLSAVSRAKRAMPVTAAVGEDNTDRLSKGTRGEYVLILYCVRSLFSILFLFLYFFAFLQWIMWVLYLLYVRSTLTMSFITYYYLLCYVCGCCHRLIIHLNILIVFFYSHFVESGAGSMGPGSINSNDLHCNRKNNEKFVSHYYMWVDDIIDNEMRIILTKNWHSASLFCLI